VRRALARSGASQSSTADAHRTPRCFACITSLLPRAFYEMALRVGPACEKRGVILERATLCAIESLQRADGGWSLADLGVWRWARQEAPFAPPGTIDRALIAQSDGATRRGRRLCVASVRSPGLECRRPQGPAVAHRSSGAGASRRSGLGAVARPLVEPRPRARRAKGRTLAISPPLSAYWRCSKHVMCTMWDNRLLVC